MTYDSRERSADLGRPVELYTFNRDFIAWRYTSADTDRVVEFQTYKRASIKRSDIEQGAEINRSGLKITVPRDFPVAQLYAIAPPSDTISLTIRQYHEGDGDLATVWSGRVLTVKFEGSQAEINLEPIGTSVRRNGLRRHYQRLCPHVLYGSGCKVNRTSFRLVATADDVAGLNVTAGEFGSVPDGYLDGGYIEWAVDTGIFDRRFIVSHAGATVTLDIQPVGLVAGVQVNAYPGCDHTMDTCNTKFSNAPNYGGMRFIPTKNPYGNDPIY